MKKIKKGRIHSGNTPDSIQVQHVPINSVKLFDRNPRINTDAAKSLSRLIEKFGQRSPIVVWKKNNVVYKGNTTLKAMKILKRDSIAVVFADFKSEAEAIAYSISDNKSHEWSEWDDDVLLELMQNEELGEFIQEIGFDEEVLKGMEVDDEIETEEERKDIIIEFETVGCRENFEKRIGFTGAVSYDELMRRLKWITVPKFMKRVKKPLKLIRKK